MTYDVYFGTTNSLQKIVSNQTGTSSSLPPLLYHTSYYWKIVAWDTHNATSEGPLWNFTTKYQTDLTPPIVEITKPIKSYVYRKDEQHIKRFISDIPLILGKITIIANVSDSQSGVKQVNFYIDDLLETIDTTTPYSWTWTEKIPLFSKHYHTIRIIAIDNANNSATKEITVWKMY